MSRVVRLRTWERYKSDVVASHTSLEAAQRELFWFRGQSDSQWPLRTTLDRLKAFDSDDDRTHTYNELLRTFRHQMIGLSAFKDLEGEPLELLGRHHGLPSMILDWTESPYIAAFFAFLGGLGRRQGRVAIWILNLAKLPQGDDFSTISNREWLRYNDRALDQRGVFLRVHSCRSPTEDLLGPSLIKYEMPMREVVPALRDLEVMNLTMRNLFRDLDGAAKSALIRWQLDKN